MHYRITYNVFQFPWLVPENAYINIKCVVSGGIASLIQGSYEYYHYLQDGFDDSVTHLTCASYWFSLNFYGSNRICYHKFDIEFFCADSICNEWIYDSVFKSLEDRDIDAVSMFYVYWPSNLWECGAQAFIVIE